MPIVLPIVLPIRSEGIGGPRVLGRAGLAWGAKGPGPDRLGLLHFQKVQYSIVFKKRLVPY